MIISALRQWRSSTKKSSISKSGGGAQCLAVIFAYLIFLSPCVFIENCLDKRTTSCYIFIVNAMLYIMEGKHMVQQLSDAELEIMKIVWENQSDAYYPKGHIPKPAESQHLRENNRRPAPGPLFFHTCKRPTADRSKNPMARRPSKRRQFPRVPASPIPPA